MKHDISMAIVIIGAVEKTCGMKHDIIMTIAISCTVERVRYEA